MLRSDVYLPSTYPRNLIMKINSSMVPILIRYLLLEICNWFDSCVKGGKKWEKKKWKEILNSFDATGRVVNVSMFSWERCYQEVPRELFLCSASTCQLIIRYWIDQSESRRKILELSGSLLEKLRCSHFRSGFRRVQIVTLFLRVFTFRLIFLLILRRL